MELKMSMSKDLLTDLMTSGIGKQTKLKSVKVRTSDGKEIDFMDLVFIIDNPVAVKK